MRDVFTNTFSQSVTCSFVCLVPCREVCHFSKVQLFFFPSWILFCCLNLITKRKVTLSLMFPSRGLVVLTFTSRPMIYIQVVFVEGIRYVLVLLCTFPTSIAAKAILSAVTCRCPFFKAPLTTFCGSFLDSLPSVARSVCLSPRQGHAILITASLEIRRRVSSTGASSVAVWATRPSAFCTNVTVTS